jgi:hypothetical protein
MERQRNPGHRPAFRCAFLLIAALLARRLG